MKKKLAVFSFLGIVSVFGVVLAALASEKNTNFVADAVIEYSLLIDGHNNTLLDSTELPQVQTLKTERGGDVQFNHRGIHYNELEGKYEVEPDGYLVNLSPINGIYRINTSDVSSEMAVRYGWRVDSLSYMYDFKGGDILFDSDYPPYVMFMNPTKETLYFGSFTYYYDCKEREEPSYTNVYDFYQLFEGVRSRETAFFETNTDLDSLDLSNLFVSMSLNENDYYNVSFGSEGMSNVGVEYVDDDLLDTVQEGTHTALISFTYQGYDLSKQIRICGYSSYEKEYDHYASFMPRSMPVQPNNNIPEDLKLQLHYRYTFYDSKSAMISESSIDDVDEIEMTQSLIKSQDENPFMTYGQKTMTVTYKDADYMVSYVIYDLENYNIMYLSFSEEDADRLFEVNQGTSADDYLNAIGTVTVTAQHYVGQPTQMTLNKDNFNVSNVDFDVLGEYLVAINVPEQHYEQQRQLRVVANMGEPDYTYTTDETVQIFMGGMYTITQIDLYEDGNLFQANYSYPSSGFLQGTYEEETNALVLITTQGLFRVSVNKENKKFTAFDYSQLEDEQTETVMADLAVIGGGPGYNYAFTLYSNGEYALDLNAGPGYVFRGKYTRNGDNVYFSLSGYSLVGTIAGSNMMVAENK